MKKLLLIPVAVAAGLVLVGGLFWMLHARQAQPAGRAQADAGSQATDTSEADAIAPTISLANPVASLQAVSGKLSLSVQAIDNIAVTQVIYEIDGKQFAVVSSPPFALQLDTTKLADGNHTVKIIAYDAADNSRATSPATFTVANTAAAKGNGAVVTNKSTKTTTSTSPTPATPPPTPGSTPTVTCPAWQSGPPACAGIALPSIAAAAGKTWVNTFSEEFGGTDYDHDKLTPCFDWNFGGCTDTFNNGREHYDPAQVQVSGGTAKLVAEPLSPPLATSNCQPSAQCTYKAGLLSTARPNAGNGSGYLYSFTYGYVEARMKVTATQGFFTAFWMLPTDPTFNYRSEIDIVEMLGDDPSTWYMHYHYNNRSQSYTPNSGKFNNGACAVKNYSQDYVRMGLDWQPDHIAWYIDGVKCGQFDGNATTIENGPMQIILHMMVDNNWQRSWGVGLLDPTLKRQLEVDYLRVFQQQ